jgi:hypothetical protein
MVADPGGGAAEAPRTRAPRPPRRAEGRRGAEAEAEAARRGRGQGLAAPAREAERWTAEEAFGRRSRGARSARPK